MNDKKKVLVAALNWGLGHATRCIPIIRFLQQQNTEVFLASDGRAFHLLKKEFPNLTIFELPSYGITYRTSSMIFNFAFLFPKMFSAISKEKKVIQKLVEENQIDIIISDNRFGCISDRAYNIFMTHQINIPIPMPVVKQIGNWYNHFQIKKFDECWIPDFEDTPNLAGKLSHFHNIKNTKYIGALSRMENKTRPIKRKAIIILSGPEPQRTYLEGKIIQQSKNLPFQFLLVKGQTESEEQFFIEKNIEVVSFMTSRDLEKAIAESEIVISRSGYTTLMDLVFLRKKAILIPTPGQTEQEYLAKHFHQQQIFLTQTQKELNLKLALEEIETFKGIEKNRFVKSVFEKTVIELLS